MFTIYDSTKSREKHPEDYARFRKSMHILDRNGIALDIRIISSADDVDASTEAGSLIRASDMEALPISEYEGTVISIEAYPTDQELTDYLDVPEDVLGISRSGTMKQPEYGCGCCVQNPKKNR